MWQIVLISSVFVSVVNSDPESTRSDSRDAEERQSIVANDQVKSDSLLFQFANDSLIRRLSVKWECDSIIGYEFTVIYKRNAETVSRKGRAFDDFPEGDPNVHTDDVLDEVFGTTLYKTSLDDCSLNIEIERLERRRALVWVMDICEPNPSLPLTSFDVLRRLDNGTPKK